MRNNICIYRFSKIANHKTTYSNIYIGGQTITSLLKRTRASRRDEPTSTITGYTLYNASSLYIYGLILSKLHRRN